MPTGAAIATYRETATYAAIDRTAAMSVDMWRKAYSNNGER